jgi:DNA helicase-2/ATP-dependent DNA helicase PcrA
MEWSDVAADAPVAQTLDAVAHFYELKNATSPSKTAADNVRKFGAGAEKVREAGKPHIKAGKDLLAAFETGLDFTGDPVADWRRARKLLHDIGALNEVFREARMVRLFRATDALGLGLADLWLNTGHYGGAVSLVTNTLEYERLIAADQEPRGCVLMTMHKSKGKEFDGVVIVEGQYSGVFYDPNREQPPFERTRRLLRVAITRAKKHVTIVRPKRVRPLTG